MDRFFVYKPVFGWVIAAFIALAGVIALRNLPVEQYPAVAPPRSICRILIPAPTPRPLIATSPR